MAKRFTWMGIFVWSCASFFYLYEYFLRVSPSVMVKELMATFQVNAGAIGVLTAIYFYAYSPMQIPVGMLMDRYGARRLLSFAALTCGLGSLLFALAPNLVYAGVGRLLIGLGSSFAFVGIVYVSSHWFAPALLALLVGLGNSFGMIGAIAGEDLLSILVNEFGWRQSMFVLAIIGLIGTAIIFLGVRGESKAGHHEPKATSLKAVFDNFKLIARNKHSWINGIMSLTFYATMSAFAGLWGIPFIVQAYGISKVLAATIVSMNFVGWLFGGPILGYFSDRIHNRRLFIIASAFLALLTLLAIIYLPPMPIWLLYTTFFFVGIFSSAQILTFPISIEINPEEAKGTAAAFTNFLVAAGGTFLAPLIGYLLDSTWNGKMVGGVPDYTVHDFRIALAILPIMLIATIVLTLFLDDRPYKKSHPKKR
ncbi:MAG: MFS transporter [Candidatus Algichlamydia australiensis]|nr:MFS transporter [Chlamydiales bacterium]